MLADGVGADFAAWGCVALLVALVAIAAIEAGVGFWLIRIPYMAAVRVSLAANAFSFLGGVWLQPVLDSHTLAAWLPRAWARGLWSGDARWVSFYVLSVAVEAVVWWCAVRHQRRSGAYAVVAALLGNTLTYALLYAPLHGLTPE
jgi:hypothetical protein